MTELPPETRVWNLIRGALGTRALAVVAELRVADALAGGPRDVADVAREVGADADTLYRLLRALASDGVFAEEGPCVFRNTEASQLLRGGGWDDFAHLFGGVWYRTVERLDRTGEPVFPLMCGTDFWSWLAGHPDERAAFDRAMVEGAKRRVERLAALEWHGNETVVDVGGGNGSLLVELIRRQPGLRGVVFDLPETDRDEDALGALGIEFVPGSFFDRVPPGDVYVLGTVLHNWDDEHAAAILGTIRDSAPPHARVLIIDSIIPSGNEPHGAKWLDLLMLTLLGSRERNEAQWRALLDSGGVAIDHLQDGLIEAHPAGGE